MTTSDEARDDKEGHQGIELQLYRCTCLVAGILYLHNFVHGTPDRDRSGTRMGATMSCRLPKDMLCFDPRVQLPTPNSNQQDPTYDVFRNSLQLYSVLPVVHVFSLEPVRIYRLHCRVSYLSRQSSLQLHTTVQLFLASSKYDRTEPPSYM